MRKEHLVHLFCLFCKSNLSILNIEKEDSGCIESGFLYCPKCKTKYPILNFIPRFVQPKNYAHNFGLQWILHARTQYDSYSRANISEKRFFEETKWERDLSGQVILEIGSGSGRFTEHAASTGAMVVSMDYSAAVEANYASNGKKKDVLIVQADVYNMPFADNYFDKLFCFGMLQHTPRVKEAFLALPRYLKPGGNMVIDIYRKIEGIKGIFVVKYWVRPFTKRLPLNLLYKLCKWYVNLMWPVSGFLNRIPGLKGRLNFIILVADYRGVYNLSEKILKEWAVLDTFDMLSPVYDYPQSIVAIREWFLQSCLHDIEVQYGYNGIEGRGTRRQNYNS